MNEYWREQLDVDMTKFEREQMSQLNRAMDRYRDALKRLVESLQEDYLQYSTKGVENAVEAALALLK